MSSRDGFARADIDVALMHDPKVVALARRQRDHERTMVTVGVYAATVLASWHAGRRVTLEEAAPAWYMGDLAEYQADLEAVGLVDGEGRVVEHAFEAWTARARAASEAARDAARARWGRNPDPAPDAAAEPSHSAGKAGAERSASGGNAQPAGLPAGSPAEPASRPLVPTPARDGAEGAAPRAPAQVMVEAGGFAAETARKRHPELPVGVQR